MQELFYLLLYFNMLYIIFRISCYFLQTMLSPNILNYYLLNFYPRKRHAKKNFTPFLLRSMFYYGIGIFEKK